jgi:hypothetical protein
MPRFPWKLPAPEIAVLGVVLVAVVAIAVTATVHRLPDRLDPFAPLDVRAEPAPMVTRLKLAHLRRDRAFCDAALLTSELRVQKVAHLSSRGCVLTDVVHVAPENRVFGPGFHATCPLAVSLAMFMRHVVQPAARRHLGSEVASVQHLGTFSCRPIRNGKPVADPKNQERDEPVVMSEHAAANAIDIVGFRTRDGQTVSIGKHWKKDSGGTRTAGPQSRQLVSAESTLAAGPAPEDVEAKAKFLREIRDGACDLFHAVLGPDYNALHRTHFHLDMGRYRQCR